ncbi:transglutaminase family protein [Patescibacteria group bacterium]|nr:transglutaminase family protein [Patescibacteria group bacterium]
MIQKLLKYLLTIFFIITFFICVRTASASENFTTDYHVKYTTAENSITHVTLNITLINTSSDYYASSYKINVGFDTINNVIASDPDGKINPIVEKTKDGYEINLEFNKKAVGFGSKLNFNLSFDSPDVAKQYGRIREINIPGIANPEEFDKFTVEISVPRSFGAPAFIKPAAAQATPGKPSQIVNNLVFSKEQLGRSGISISFGDKQIYSFHLIYHLKNDNLYPIETDIALPPTTNYQNIFLQSINPRPENVILDKDNNWLARFRIPPAKRIDIVVDGKAEIFLVPKPEDLSTQDLSRNLEEKPYWQTKSSEIRRLANELRTPEAIYNYVVKTLKYDFTRVTDDKPRMGALKVLQNPNSAVCLEYTDLFIAIARAAGIPAREVNGFAYTQNSKQRPLSLVKDILHAWPEYYDTQKKTWVMVDPTWGSTTGGVDYFSTLDFDHLVFVIKGADSNYPIPAGGYKFITEKNTKDISVDFSRNIPQEEIVFNIISSLPEYMMSSFPIRGKISIKNNGQNIIYPQILSITSADLSPQAQAIRTSSIPPFGMSEINVSFDAEPFLTNSVKSFKIRMDNQEITQKIDISPLLIKKWQVIGGVVGISIFCITIFIFAVKGRRL